MPITLALRQTVSDEEILVLSAPERTVPLDPELPDFVLDLGPIFSP